MAKGSNGKNGNGAAPRQASAEAVGDIQLTLPVGSVEQSGYQSELIAGGEMSLDVTAAHLNINVGARGASAFVRVRNGLRAAGSKLQDGRPVWTNADALRFIVDAIADAVEAGIPQQ